MERRPATLDEARALAHPVRLRILRLCMEESLTNKEIARRLGRDPGAVLHHVRTLLRTGFLVEEGVQKGKSGALEKPYRATGKSWRLETGAEPAGGVLPGLEAFREELYEAGVETVEWTTRLAMRLNEASLAELRRRLVDLFDEFGLRDDSGGELYGAFFGLHRFVADPSPAAPAQE